MSKPFLSALARWPSAVAAGPFLFVSGQMGLDAAGDPQRQHPGASADRPEPGSAYGWVSGLEGPVEGQAIGLYERYRDLLAPHKLAIGDVVRYHIFQRDKRFFSAFDRVRRHYESAPPASTAVGMGRFEPADRIRLCVDSIVYRGTPDAPGGRSVLAGSKVQAAAAHFSHVIGAGPFLFVAGQIPLDTSQPGSPLVRGYADIPEEGRFLSVGRSHEDARNGPIAAQTWFTYDLIRKHLQGAGSSMDRIMNLVVYLQDMRDFPTFHRVHEHFFPDHAPALTVIEAGEVGHKGTLIEIEPTAVTASSSLRLDRLVDDEAERCASMSAACGASGLTFLSGVPGLMPSGEPALRVAGLPTAWRKVLPARLPSGTDPAFAAQTAAVIGRLAARMKALGARLDRIVHLTLFVDDIDQFSRMLPVFERAFGRQRQALYVVEVPKVSPVPGTRISATAIAWLGEDAPKPVALEYSAPARRRRES